MKYFVLSFFVTALLLGEVYSGVSECSPEEEGLTKPLECNRCICRRGIWFCTKIGCFSHISKRELTIAADLKNIPCAPNDYFQIDCNTCYCNLERSGYLCTENICDGPFIGGPSTQIPLLNSSILLIVNNTAQIIKNGSNIEDNSTSILPKIDVTQLRDPTRRHPKIFKSLLSQSNDRVATNNSTTGATNSTTSGGQ